MSTEAETAVELFNPQQFSESIATAPSVLEANRMSVIKAKEAGQAMLDTIEGSGMTDELDAAANDLQVKIKKTYDTLQDRRKPMTQLLDQLKKEFTGLEAEIDPKNPLSHFARIQTYRNNFAQKKLEEQKRRDAEAKAKLERDKEMADYRAKCEVAVHAHFNNALTLKLSNLTGLLNTATLETIDQNAQLIIAFPEEYPQSYHNQATLGGVFYMYLKDADMQPVLQQVKDETFSELNRRYAEEVRKAKDDLSLRVPARRNELNEIAEAQRKQAEAEAAAKAAKDAEEADRLAKEAEDAKAEAEAKEKEAADRKQQEDAKAEAEAAERAKEAERQAEANKQAATMQSLFDATADAQAPTANAKEAYEIIVKNNAGYLLLAQFWFEKEGMKATAEDIEKKTFKQIRAFCEKWALKNDELIKSPYIEYKEVAKATVKR